MGHIRDSWKTPGRRGRGLRWVAVYRDASGRERSESFAAKDVATRRLAEVTTDLARGRWVDPNLAITVAEQCVSHAANRRHGPGTSRRIAGMIKNHVAGTRLGGMRLGQVRPSDVQQWVTSRSAVPLAASTVRLLVKELRSALNAAALDGLISTNPAARIALPHVEIPRVVPLSVEQVQALAAAMPAQYRALVWAQSGLGLRLAELLALRVQDVDWLRKSVRIDAQIGAKSRQRVPPKTPRSHRTLPMPALVSDALAAHLAAYPAAPNGLIFHTRNDTPIWQDHYGSIIFAKAVERAGLPAGTRSHDLRHFYASILLDAGEPVTTVAERLGHATASMVLEVYGHMIAGKEDRTRGAVDDAFGAGSPAVPTRYGRSS